MLLSSHHTRAASTGVCFQQLHAQLLQSEDDICCLEQYIGGKAQAVSSVKPLFGAQTQRAAPDASFLTAAALVLFLAGGGRSGKFYGMLVCIHT